MEYARKSILHSFRIMQPPPGQSNPLICPYCSKVAFEDCILAVAPRLGDFAHCSHCFGVVVFALGLVKPDQERDPVAWAHQQSVRS